MNPRLLDHYRNELRHVREMGAEFAAEFPKIAGRLGLESLECSDPYVERLLESYAFLAARVQLGIENSYGELARHLLEMLYPQALMPTPSMCVVEMTPSLDEGSLQQGFVVERGARLRSRAIPDVDTECVFRTARDVTLWPMTLDGIRYLPNSAALKSAGVARIGEARSGLALEFSLKGGAELSALPLEQLSLYVTGSENDGFELHEQLARHTVRVSICVDQRELEVKGREPLPILRAAGFSEQEALLPDTQRSFKGHRLLAEYFALPERFRFVDLCYLAGPLKQASGGRFTLVLQFGNSNEKLLSRIDAANLRLHSVPAINSFEKSLDRIHLRNTEHEFHVLADRTRPMDFEILSLEAVTGHGRSGTAQQTFQPYFGLDENNRNSGAFFQTRREARRLSSKQKQRGPRSSYVGSEVFISIVDASEAPYRSELRQLAMRAICSNRDLPLQMPVGRGDTDFTLDVGAPLASIRVVAGPTVPRASRAENRDAWRLVNALCMNRLSIEHDRDGSAAAAQIRRLLELHLDENAEAQRRQLEGIIAIKVGQAVRRRVDGSHVEFARGLAIELDCDESAFEGAGVYLLASVLERYFARFASINSFTETSLRTIQRNHVERWPVRLGQRDVA